MSNLPSEKIAKIHEWTGFYIWNDYIFDLQFPLHCDVLVAAILQWL